MEVRAEFAKISLIHMEFACWIGKQYNLSGRQAVSPDGIRSQNAFWDAWCAISGIIPEQIKCEGEK